MLPPMLEEGPREELGLCLRASVHAPYPAVAYKLPNFRCDGPKLIHKFHKHRNARSGPAGLGEDGEEALIPDLPVSLPIGFCCLSSHRGCHRKSIL